MLKKFSLKSLGPAGIVFGGNRDPPREGLWGRSLRGGSGKRRPQDAGEDFTFFKINEPFTINLDFLRNNAIFSIFSILSNFS